MIRNKNRLNYVTIGKQFIVQEVKNMRIYRFTQLCLLLLFSFSLAQMSSAQPLTAPLSENLALKPAATFDGSPIPFFRVYIPTQGNQLWCVPDGLAPDKIDSLWKADCGTSDLNITVADSCITLSASNITFQYRDTICFTLRTIKGTEIPFKLDVLVNPPYHLPFIEDFSSKGPYPGPFKWQDYDVYVNHTLAMNPPSIGVATFDGIDGSGNPYNTGYGKSDYLTSNVIDLSGQFNAHIRFWYQARGLGFQNYPRLKDSLLLQFKTVSGQWNTVWSIPGIGSAPTEGFKSVSLAIPPAYIGEAFQFRFVNYSDNDGMLSFWHIDYIFVTDHETSASGIQDIAFTEPAQSILTPYRAMPYMQFKGNEEKYVRDSIRIELFNHFNSTRLANPSRFIVSLKNQQTTELLNETLLEVPPTVDENQRNLSSGEHIFHNKIKLRNSALLPNLENLNYKPKEEFLLVSEMKFQSSGEPVSLQGNNHTSFSSSLGDHYAYDDGTAEVGMYIPAGNNFPTVVQKFTLDKKDTLKALRFHFPHIRPNVTKQRFRIVVYQGDLNEDSEPIYEEAFSRAIFASSYYDSLSGFTTFALKVDGRDTGLVIPPGDLYVGWQQISSNTQFGVYIGYDKNTPTVAANDNILFSTDGSSWQVYNTVPGALMIRPVFGKGQPISTDIAEAYPQDKLNIYPNPSSGSLSITGENLTPGMDILTIYSAAGQQVYSAPYQESINLNSLPAGKYFIRLFNPETRKTLYGEFVLLP